MVKHELVELNKEIYKEEKQDSSTLLLKPSSWKMVPKICV